MLYPVILTFEHPVFLSSIYSSVASSAVLGNIRKIPTDAQSESGKPRRSNDAIYRSIGYIGDNTTLHNTLNCYEIVTF